jgi:peptidyl-prolyl cis-trans isomerase SurA
MKKQICLFILIPSLFFCEEDTSAVFIDGIAAIVGEHLVLKSDVAQLVNMAAVQRRLNPATDMDKLLLLQQEIVRSAVDQKIILEMAAVDSVEVEDKGVDRALDQQIEMFVSQAGGEERAEEMLGQTLKSFRREFWYEMKDRLTTEKYQQSLITKININRSDVENFLLRIRIACRFFLLWLRCDIYLYLFLPERKAERWLTKNSWKLGTT